MTERMIIRQRTRILTPREYILLRRELNPVYQVICDCLLHTGMRVEELWEFLQHPHWYHASARVIDLPIGSIKKVKTLHKERSVKLAKDGCNAVEVLISIKPKKISRQSMHEVLINASTRAGIGTKGITSKMFRKTNLSWLVAIHPDKALYVASHAGHTIDILQEHYLGIAFTPEDKADMRNFFKGWDE
jgi:integrase